jgi:uncharacterized protein YdaU (DUF1376 family)
MPFYVADYLADTSHLSTVEHGAYLLLIMHYWQSGGLPAEDRKLARIARLNEREWTGIRETIAEFFDDNWQHSRIESELAKAEDKISKRSAAGKAGAAVRHKQTLSKRKTNASQPQPQSEDKKEDASASSKESARRGSRLPDGWMPTDKQRDALKTEGFTDADLDRELPRFRDYWIAKPGAGGRKLDWDATFRNWLRKAHDLRGSDRAPAGGGQGGQRPGGGGLAGAGLRRELHYREMERGQQPGGDDHPEDGRHPKLVEGVANPGPVEQRHSGAAGECLADGFGSADGGAEGQRGNGRDEAGSLLSRPPGVSAGRG